MWRTRSAGIPSWTLWNGKTPLVLLVLLSTLFLNASGDWKKFGPGDPSAIPFEQAESAEEIEDDHPDPLTGCLLDDSLPIDLCLGSLRPISSPRVCLPLGYFEAQLCRGPPA